MYLAVDKSVVSSPTSSLGDGEFVRLEQQRLHMNRSAARESVRRIRVSADIAITPVIAGYVEIVKIIEIVESVFAHQFAAIFYCDCPAPLEARYRSLVDL